MAGANMSLVVDGYMFPPFFNTSGANGSYIFDVPAPWWRRGAFYHPFKIEIIKNTQSCSSSIQTLVLADHKLKGPAALSEASGGWVWSQENMTERVIVQVRVAVLGAIFVLLHRQHHLHCLAGD